MTTDASRFPVQDPATAPDTAVVAASVWQPKPGQRAAMIDLVTELARQIHAEEGSLHYSAHRSLDDDGPLLVIQMFASIEAFREHSANIQAQLPRLAALVATAPAPPQLFTPIPLGGDLTKQSLAA